MDLNVQRHAQSRSFARISKLFLAFRMFRLQQEGKAEKWQEFSRTPWNNPLNPYNHQVVIKREPQGRQPPSKQDVLERGASGFCPIITRHQKSINCMAIILLLVFPMYLHRKTNLNICKRKHTYQKYIHTKLSWAVTSRWDPGRTLLSFCLHFHLTYFKCVHYIFIQRPSMSKTQGNCEVSSTVKSTLNIAHTGSCPRV